LGDGRVHYLDGGNGPWVHTHQHLSTISTCSLSCIIYTSGKLILKTLVRLSTPAPVIAWPCGPCLLLSMTLSHSPACELRGRH
jgi:hypothetical protein